jgi:hypothetical protein
MSGEIARLKPLLSTWKSCGLTGESASAGLHVRLSLPLSREFIPGAAGQYPRRTARAMFAAVETTT